MEKQERKSRIVLFLAFLLTLVCLGLLAAAMGSEHWVAADIRPYSALGEDVHVSTVHHGLFAGELQREAFVQIFHSNITITCDASTRICRYDADDPSVPPSTEFEGNISLNTFCTPAPHFTGNLLRPGEISFWSWVTVVIFLSLAMLFGLVAAIFTMVNVLYVPISDIVGVAGVYVWNIAAAVCTLITICVWSGLYYSHLRYNILPVSVLSMRFTTCGLARHGVAVWLCLAALLLFLANVVIIWLRRGARTTAKNPMFHKGRKEYRKGEETLY